MQDPTWDLCGIMLPTKGSQVRVKSYKSIISKKGLCIVYLDRLSSVPSVINNIIYVRGICNIPHNIVQLKSMKSYVETICLGYLKSTHRFLTPMQILFKIFS